MADIILVTGGARSGKSGFALEQAEKISSKRLFIATCPKIDEEMSKRVVRHQEERRGRGWASEEVELDLARVFKRSTNQYDVILIDCITLWVNNVLHKYDLEGTRLDDAVIKQLCLEWLKVAKTFKGTVICVTNEVGLGIVPDNELARNYRDLVGTCNQLIGSMATRAVLVSCGIPLVLKDGL